MGAWGVDNFDNDDAAEWVDDLENSEDLSLIIETLETITNAGGDYIEALECCRALAAAEVVAALKSAGDTHLPDPATQWVNAHRGEDVKEAVVLALKAVERIRTDSELKDLFDETDSAQDWYAVLSELQAKLTL